MCLHGKNTIERREKAVEARVEQVMPLPLRAAHVVGRKTKTHRRRRNKGRSQSATFSFLWHGKSKEVLFQVMGRSCEGRDMNASRFLDLRGKSRETFFQVVDRSCNGRVMNAPGVFQYAWKIEGGVLSSRHPFIYSGDIATIAWN